MHDGGKPCHVIILSSVICVNVVIFHLFQVNYLSFLYLSFSISSLFI